MLPDKQRTPDLLGTLVAATSSLHQQWHILMSLTAAERVTQNLQPKSCSKLL